MEIQKLNNCCSLVHLNEVHHPNKYDISDTEKFKAFLLNKHVTQSSSVLYVCSDYKIYKKLYKLGFRIQGSYINQSDYKVFLLVYCPNKKENILSKIRNTLINIKMWVDYNEI